MQASSQAQSKCRCASTSREIASFVTRLIPMPLLGSRRCREIAATIVREREECALRLFDREPGRSPPPEQRGRTAVDLSSLERTNSASFSRQLDYGAERSGSGHGGLCHRSFPALLLDTARIEAGKAPCQPCILLHVDWLPIPEEQPFVPSCTRTTSRIGHAASTPHQKPETHSASLGCAFWGFCDLSVHIVAGSSFSCETRRKCLPTDHLH
jgi:hypothetical protein